MQSKSFASFFPNPMSFAIPIIPVGTRPQRRPMAEPPVEPQPTLYVRNLPENKKLDALKKELQTLFAQFGGIIDLKIKNNIKHRGQAFVSFNSIDEAKSAKDSLHGFLVFEKPMDVQFAREPSYANSKLLGTFEEQKKRREEIRAKRLVEPPVKKQKRSMIKF